MSGYSSASSFDSRPAPDFSFLLGGRNSKGYPSYGDRRNYAESLGYRVQGDKVLGSYAGKRTTTPLGQFVPPGTGGGGGWGTAGMMGELRGALYQDSTAQQAMMDRQWDRNQQQIGSLDRFLGGIDGRIAGATNPGIFDLQRMSGEAIGTAQEHLQQNMRAGAGIENRLKGDLDKVWGGLGRASSMLNQANADVDGANRIAASAVSGFARAISEYQDTSVQDAATVAGAIRRSAQADMAMVRSGQGPDGQSMTPQQQADLENQVKRGTAEMVQQAVVPMFARFNENRANLKGALANLQMSQAGIMLQGAQVRQSGAALEQRGAEIGLGAAMGAAQVGLAVQGQTMQGQEAVRAAQQLAIGVRQFTTQLAQSAVFNSINLELQGRTALAQMVANNPEGQVSLFQGLLALYAAQSSQGGGSGVRLNNPKKSTPRYGGFATFSGGSGQSPGKWGGAYTASGRTGGGSPRAPTTPKENPGNFTGNPNSVFV
jgi:hypothetical protein